MYLDNTQLFEEYPKAQSMNADDMKTYLNRANSWAAGVIGGQLPADKIDQPLRTAVAMAFEIFATNETDQVDTVTGNITAEAPAGSYAQKARTPLKEVETMLMPYARMFDSLNAKKSDRGARFL